MNLKIGVDVGGTFTDFLVTQKDEEPKIFKVLSTPLDPSIGLINGFSEIAKRLGFSLNELGKSIETIVHGTTVTTNAVLTHTGAKTALLTTEGVRDALEMRRGIREERYNNRATNVPPLVPRYLRFPVRGRLNYRGETITPLQVEDIEQAIRTVKKEKVEAISICFMNSFANSEQEKKAAELIRKELPEANLTVSSDLLPSIRFYDRVSTTVLNSYVGPKFSSYLNRLKVRLKEMDFGGVLLIMQSNGGVMSPEIALESPARTLLSGPAAAPGAGLYYVGAHNYGCCLTVDMGGTSFDAALVQDGTPDVNSEGEINRYRIALPMLNIVTIGAGGGSIGWIDEGGLLRMGPQSAGANPGPACYGKDGTQPTCTDADLVLGYLNADFFAGGKIKLHHEKALKAIETHLAKPLGLSTQEAAAGMYRVINTNMAQGVREISIKRGFDPREFPMVVAGGAGPLHACMICQELEIPLFIVPRESSIFCAAGMLMSDLQHDFVRSFVSAIHQIDWKKLNGVVTELMQEGEILLEEEKIPENRRDFSLTLDCRYLKQYHEVSFPLALEFVRERDLKAITTAFHTEHKRLYGYSLEQENTPIELINVRLRAVGSTQKPSFQEESYQGSDCKDALKGERKVYLPEEKTFKVISVMDGHQLHHGNSILGPALIEQNNTTLFLSSSYDCLCDRYGSFVVFQKGKEDILSPSMKEMVS